MELLERKRDDVRRPVKLTAKLLPKLRVGAPAHLHRAVAEAMTIKETSFFRDPAAFQVLRERLIPMLIEACRERRQLRLWSAGCSTGQEAYSLAMLLHEDFPETEDWDVTIVGTEISRAACEYAARGRYGRLEINRGLPARQLLRYFQRDGEEWVVGDVLRRWVRFECADLCRLQVARAGAGAESRFDLVLLRNVLLYLAEKDRQCVLRNVHARMQPYAPLLLGNAEQAEDFCEMFGLQFDKNCYFYRPLPVV